MIAFVRGNVFQTMNDSIILDNHGIGYQIFTPDPKQYVLGSEVLLYTYQYVREDAILLYGFKEKEAYDLFIRLIEVKGLGCKSAMNMLSIGQVGRIIQAIDEGNTAFLKGCPGIGAKTAQQIVLDLKG
ncbi:MAG: Holliday junction branch migration protein RuvA, partial [Traorella sp.]